MVIVESDFCCLNFDPPRVQLCLSTSLLDSRAWRLTGFWAEGLLCPCIETVVVLAYIRGHLAGSDDHYDVDMIKIQHLDIIMLLMR